ncbi:MAG: hypothetical protein AVDCRST_MAG61-3075 [uncultured Friedmanniella sp.]|uniref:Uncharacterized protein n=1 Tax=uncultured Friedmanniella sp. TaxID=335381 RepID=A0A6J4LKA5_9ACTN|nr:hypothetical protein [uncultured Friedmanniella sp.]CAA9334003.1 MAG: hypothetical protein AVDCRST_MAG61-3075 [uncultured Friedmanniella sp.]
MSTPEPPEPPPGGPEQQPGRTGPVPPVPPGEDPWPTDYPEDDGYPRLSPLRGEDPPRVGNFWLDARMAASPAGVVFTAHDADNQPALVVLLSEGATADAAARERLAGVVNGMHIDEVLARGGHGQDSGRLARKYRPDHDGPVPPDAELVAPWVALAYDGFPSAPAQARRILDEVEIATLPPLGAASGPGYQHYWIDRVRPGLARLWPLPWPGRYDRAGWRTILVSWLLMLLLAALAVLIAILIFRNQPPQSPPPPTGQSGSPPPASSSPSPQSGSPSPQSGSPSPESGSPSPSGSESGSPSPSGSESGSPSPSGSQSGSPSPSGSESGSGSPSPSPSQSGGPGPTPDPSGSPGSPSPRSRL